MRTLRDTTCFDTRIDLDSILVYVVRQVLALAQSDCMIITSESHLRMGVDEENRRWVEAIGIGNTQNAEL